jgi:hypothetical protein
MQKFTVDELAAISVLCTRSARSARVREANALHFNHEGIAEKCAKTATFFDMLAEKCKAMQADK